MDAFNAKTAFELHLSTQSKQCRNAGSGNFEWTLDYMERKPEECLKIGIKNLKIPAYEKAITFKLLVMPIHQKLEPITMRTFTINSRSF